jgi:hypothetical protein
LIRRFESSAELLTAWKAKGFARRRGDADEGEAAVILSPSEDLGA